MFVIEGYDVNEMLSLGAIMLAEIGHRESSRAGDVIVAPFPVVSVYENPTRRVLMSPTRDANPFFHLMESLWMLAGRDDSAFLDVYVRDFGSRFAERGGVIHGAYGKRWRGGLGIDQLRVVVEKLRRNPQDRQCVIQMWDVGPFSLPTQEPEIYRADLTGNWKDRPCNTHVYLRVRGDGEFQMEHDGTECRGLVLDLTVCCRSNDMIWGAYGANAVHFSVLQEYLAGRIGVGVGKMYQFSNNFHAYVGALDRLGSPEDLVAEYQRLLPIPDSTPIGDAWDAWDDDLRVFMTWHDNAFASLIPDFSNAWFSDVACTAALAHAHHRRGEREEAITQALQIQAPDWREACVAWLGRRYAK